MRDGWGEWLGGTILAIVAAALLPAIIFVAPKSVPPLPLLFYAVYGAVGLVIAAGAAILLYRGWKLLHPIQRLGGDGSEAR